jgi:uncharacterized protein (TIGR02466 family)
MYRSRLTVDPGFLAEYATRRQVESTGVELSNRGGWQSPDLLTDFARDAKCRQVLDELEALIRRFVEAYKGVDRPEGGVSAPFDLEIGNLWANLNGPGDWNAGHHHPGAHISGVFYAQAPEDCGELVVRPPYTFLDVVLDVVTQPSVQPEAGMVLLFPSDVYHYMEPNRGTGTRISYAFNARYRPRSLGGRTFL